jgi:hypothetical protein
MLSLGASLLLKNSYSHYLLQRINRAKVEKTALIRPKDAAEAPGFTGPQEAVSVDPWVFAVLFYIVLDASFE